MKIYTIGKMKNTNNVQVLRKIRKLLEEIHINAFYGLGKPEPLKHNFSGQWSRRINHPKMVASPKYIIFTI